MSDFKVIIAGAGIAGLTLANMLEKHGLNYVVLESHSKVVAEAGASIGLFPHGLRILDQLGLYEKITDVFEGQVSIGRTYIRRADGAIVSKLGHITAHMVQRHGYPFLFFDRQDLLQILYDNLRHKDRVLVRKTVSDIEVASDGVSVTCKDGSVYSGAIVVGADGVHSAVRDIMRALAKKLEPGYFESNEHSQVPCFYRCSFGIAQHVPNWPRGDQQMVLGYDKSQLLVPGPDNKVYWFLFDRLPETKRGPDIPRFTKDDEADLVKVNCSLPVTENITFGDVYKHKISSALTPLHEVVYKKWHFHRIITIGDSAHKVCQVIPFHFNTLQQITSTLRLLTSIIVNTQAQPNPISGQGGNGAIESCAELVNAIIGLKTQRGDSLTGLTTQQVSQAFSKVQNARHKRADLAVQGAHRQQALFAYESPLKSYIINDCILPHIGAEPMLCRNASLMLGASVIKSLPVPHRSRVIPFHDELPATRASGKLAALARAVLIGSMGAALVLTFTAMWSLSDGVEAAELYGMTKTNWFGESTASHVLYKVVSKTILPPLEGVTLKRIHLAYFLSQLISPLLIYSIEGHRFGNQATPLAFPSFFSWAMQFQGIGRLAPLHAILLACFNHTMPTGRPVPIEFARSLVPAIVLGCILPVVMVFLPLSPDTRAWQYSLVSCQIFPPLFNLLTRVFSSVFMRLQQQRSKPSESAVDVDALMESYGNRDVPALKSAYTLAFAVQAAVHLTALSYTNWVPTIATEMSVFLRYDFAVAVTAFLCSALYSVWEIRRLGYVETRDAIKAAAAVVLGQLLVGPGAAWVGIWYWRESILSTVRLQA